MSASPNLIRVPLSASPKPWVLPAQGLAVYHGCPETLRLFHYFLPQALLAGRQILCLDGANRFDPLLISRFARQRGVAPASFNQHLRVARAFTCFQLTELLRRVPRALHSFAADVLVLTAFPDLYFDEDVRDAAAAVSCHEALRHLETILRCRLPVAVFSDAPSYTTPRQAFFRRLLNRASQVWRFTVQADNSVALGCEKSAPQLPQGMR